LVNFTLIRRVIDQQVKSVCASRAVCVYFSKRNHNPSTTREISSFTRTEPKLINNPNFKSVSAVGWVEARLYALKPIIMMGFA